ncbi:MAG TPA: class I SAM-dependent methyltransferase [Candidatus Acidoferrales bacterium]|nr:class I SAM-dependent methyltransferase [Candidatus Acidoferrales bacterium]
MEREYSDAYAKLHRRHWWFQAREEVVLDALRRHRPAGGWAGILDVGCGDGLLFDRLEEFGRVEGVEPDAAVIGARHRDRIYATPFDERFQTGKQYSLILMLDVLEHLPDAHGALALAIKLLVPAGHLLVTVPAFPVLWTTHDDLNHHARRYTKASFRAAMNGAPLRILEERYLFQSLFPAKLAVRAAERLFRLPARVPSIPPSWLNGAMRGYLRFEERVLRQARVPFGSSLLVMGQKAE